MRSHIPHYIVLVLLFITSNVNAVLGLHCLSCSDAVAPTDCDTVQLCSFHESCFIEVNVLNTGHIRYQMGCRDTRQCTRIQSSAGRRELQIMDSDDGKLTSQNKPNILSFASSTFTDLILLNSSPDVVHRRSRDLLVCSDCCTNDLCNSAGCGQTGYISPRGPICFLCSQQLTPDDCNKITICGENQVCMLLKIQNQMTHVVRYQTHCEEENVCRNTENIASLITGKRQLGGGCAVSCCKTDLCNQQCTSTLAVISSTPQFSQTAATIGVGTTTTISPNDPCLSNPCMRGTCSADQNTYRCACEPGYFGQHCDQVNSPTTQSAMTTQSSQISTTGLDACLSNPCMWGQCSPILTTYKCTCDHGYWGRNCEKGGQISLTTDGAPTTMTAPSPTTASVTHPGACSGYVTPCRYGYCADTVNGVWCHCLKDYMAPWMLTCTDVPYCENVRQCFHGGACLHHLHECSCATGYRGENCLERDPLYLVQFKPGDLIYLSMNASRVGYVIGTNGDKSTITVKWIDDTISYVDNMEIQII